MHAPARAAAARELVRALGLEVHVDVLVRRPPVLPEHREVALWPAEAIAEEIHEGLAALRRDVLHPQIDGSAGVVL